jgi:hypothetical protein
MDLKGVSTVNININIQNIHNGNSMVFYDKRPTLEINYPVQNSPKGHTTNILPKSPDKSEMNSPSKWRKLSNIIRSVKGLFRYDTRNIGNDNDIDNELKDYKDRLLNNTLKNRDDFRINESFNMSQIAQDEYNENLKEQVMQYIIEYYIITKWW